MIYMIVDDYLVNITVSSFNTMISIFVNSMIACVLVCECVCLKLTHTLTYVSFCPFHR